MSRVLVTGASGFIGSSLWRRLVQEEDEVHCVSRHPHQETRVRWWQTDLTDPDEAAELVQRVRPDVIYHLAGLNVASKDLDAVLPVLRHNLVLTVNVLVAAVRANCGLVLLPDPSRNRSRTSRTLCRRRSTRRPSMRQARMRDCLQPSTASVWSISGYSWCTGRGRDRRRLCLPS